MASETQIKQMVDRFLGWKLPENFNPDGGISFKPVFNEGTEHEFKAAPTGTNLFNAEQAEALIRFIVDGAHALAGSRRISIETIASGQPRPYADTIRQVRLTFEYYAGYPAPGRWKPDDRVWTEESVRAALPRLNCGFTDKTRQTPGVEWFDTTLDWLKQTSPGVWEFHTTTPFTD